MANANTELDPDDPHYIDPQAAKAISDAADALRPYSSDARVAALVTKLMAIANPVTGDDDTSDDDTQLSKALQDVVKIEKSEDVSEQVRKRAGETRLDLERALLRHHSPAGSAAYEEAATAAGRV